MKMRFLIPNSDRGVVPQGKATRGPRAAGAFTLIEIMIAFAIFSLVLMAIYASWSAVVRASKVGLDVAAQVQRTRMAMRSIVDALLSVQMYAANAPYYSFYVDTSSDFAHLSFVARLPASFPDSGLFGDQVVRRVTFTVEPGVNALNQPVNQLVMYQMPLLAEENSEQKPFQVVLAKEISMFALEFWDTRANKWATEWLATNQLPKLVRVTLGFGQANNFRLQPEDLVIRTVALPAMVVPREYQSMPPTVTVRSGADVDRKTMEIMRKLRPEDIMSMPPDSPLLAPPTGGPRPVMPPGAPGAGPRRGR
jgi:type II secretory pathway pseudopilin PulG